MNKTGLKSLLSLFLCVALLAAAALSTGALGETAADTEARPTEYSVLPDGAETPVVIPLSGTKEAPVDLGDGAKTFLFSVVDMAGVDCWFRIHTDRETVGEALTDALLISGTVSEEYGLMVDTVCGTQLIWSEENPHYWAFYINGEYAMTGVSSTPIEADAEYSFRAE